MLLQCFVSETVESCCLYSQAHTWRITSQKYRFFLIMLRDFSVFAWWNSSMYSKGGTAFSSFSSIISGTSASLSGDWVWPAMNNFKSATEKLLSNINQINYTLDFNDIRISIICILNLTEIAKVLKWGF